MTVKLIGSFALLAFFAVKPAQSQQIIPINDDVHEHMFTETDVAYMEDSKNQLTIADVSGPLKDKFILNRLFSPHNANTNSSYWIRLRIQDNPASKRKWILEFFDQTTDYIEAYIPKGNGYEKKFMGDQFDFHNRTFQHKNFEIFLENNTNTSHDYYFKVKSSNHLNIIIVLRSIDHFIYYSLNEYLLFTLSFSF